MTDEIIPLRRSSVDPVVKAICGDDRPFEFSNIDQLHDAMHVTARLHEANAVLFDAAAKELGELGRRSSAFVLHEAAKILRETARKIREIP